jgi:biopolymer transport protein ExbD
MPVSLSPGRIRTAEFEINTRSSYRITFIARQGFGHQPGPSEPDYYQYCLPDLVTSWSLSNRGRVVAKSAGQMCDSLGEFTAGSGRYVLDVHVLRDGGRFNSYGPRLAVYEVGGAQVASDNQGILAFWSLVVLTTLGAGAVISSTIQRRHERLDSFVEAWPLTLPESQLPPRGMGAGPRLKAITPRRAPMIADYYLGDPKASARRPFTGLPSTGLITLFIYLFVFMAIWSFYWFPLIPVGLKVGLLRPGATGQTSPGIQPLIVQVAFERRPTFDGRIRQRPSLFVNRKLVSRDDFETVLQKELTMRPPYWPVYLEGDSDMDWLDAVEVVDIVQKLHAQVILLTSRATVMRSAGSR